MTKYNLNSIEMLADFVTPVSVFINLRDNYPEIVLLESSDYASYSESKSFICFEPIQTLKKSNGKYSQSKIQGHNMTHVENDAVLLIENWLANISVTSNEKYDNYLGVFGYSSFEMVHEFEDIQSNKTKPSESIDVLRYDLFKYTIVFDHYYEKLILLELVEENEESKLTEVVDRIKRQDIQNFPFSTTNQIHSNTSIDKYKALVKTAKSYCQKGDIFQIVLSRKFKQNFQGDEFNVYRTLRSINPSPYLFYFDYGNYKIFGSSPEAQLIVNKGIAEIHPIAGTFKRTGNIVDDNNMAIALLADPKENAEHTMLVDLARNDLSKNCTDVHVSNFKEVQYFSHVIHLVSKVKGKLKNGVSSYRIFADSFPAGTLSGAPKYKALQLIDELEVDSRSFYGGGIGMLGLNGNLNHAIIIRSMLSINKQLIMQAGAGIVIDSNEEKESNEVLLKLGALQKAIHLANFKIN